MTLYSIFNIDIKFHIKNSLRSIGITLFIFRRLLFTGRDFDGLGQYVCILVCPFKVAELQPHVVVCHKHLLFAVLRQKLWGVDRSGAEMGEDRAPRPC